MNFPYYVILCLIYGKKLHNFLVSLTCSTQSNIHNKKLNQYDKHRYRCMAQKLNRSIYLVLITKLEVKRPLKSGVLQRSRGGKRGSYGVKVSHSYNYKLLYWVLKEQCDLKEEK